MYTFIKWYKTLLLFIMSFCSTWLNVSVSNTDSALLITTACKELNDEMRVHLIWRVC